MLNFWAPKSIGSQSSQIFSLGGLVPCHPYMIYIYIYVRKYVYVYTIHIISLYSLLQKISVRIVTSNVCVFFFRIPNGSPVFFGDVPQAASTLGALAAHSRPIQVDPMGTAKIEEYPQCCENSTIKEDR